MKSYILQPARKGRCCEPNSDQDLLPLMFPLMQYLIREIVPHTHQLEADAKEPC